MPNVVLVVDMVRGFLEPGHNLYCGDDVRNRDYPVEVPADCVATLDPDAHAWALRHIQKILGAQVV